MKRMMASNATHTGRLMKRFVQLVAISLGVLLVTLTAAGVVLLLVLNYRTERKHSDLVQALSKKFASITAKADVLWDTDMRPFGFPEDNFDTPYLDSAAPSTVAVSDSLVAVTFRKSRYEGQQLVEDGHLITLSLATGSVVTTTHWPAEWQRKKVLAPLYQRLIGVGPYVYCCDDEGYFYGYSDDYLVMKDGKVTSRREDNPGGLIMAKPSVVLGTNGRSSTVEISHPDGSTTNFQSGCGGVVHYSFISGDVLVVTTDCGTLFVIGTDGHLIFSDEYHQAHIQFGGASRNGKRFVLAMAAWHPGDPSYMTDEWLTVYDIDHRRPVFAWKSDPLPYLQSQTALSADGTRLLIGSGAHLKLIRLSD
jgi:hypothetical protein